MPDTSPTLSLPYLLPSQAQKHVTHNEALQVLDVAVQTAVIDRDRTEPPGSPAFGDCHIVAVGASGGWAGQGGMIAQYNGSDWGFFAAKQGWRAQVLAEGKAVVFDGADWAAQTSVPDMIDNLDGVGVGTTSDATNRLAVAAAATLLSHEGTSHQLKINKAGAGDTASLLFQTGWSGRAEMGTAGADDFAIKVSADGAAWATGLSFDAATGQAALPQGAQVDGAVTGTAVQQSADDVTPGRLMRADYGYGPGTLLGPVSQSGGVPAGAVIERGSNANGDYVRFADGMLVCTKAGYSVPYNGPAILYGTWIFPAVFVTGSETVVSVLPDWASIGSTGPGRAGISTFAAANVLTSSCQIGVTRVIGATNFSAIDACDVYLTAIGRWF